MSNKQEDIKQAATLLFSYRGFDGTTVPMIAEEASVGAGTIYRYFENKEFLLNVIVQDAFIHLKETLLAHYPTESTMREQFSHILYTLIKYVHEHFASIMLISSHSTSRHLNEQTVSLQVDLFGFISDLIEQGREEGVLNRQLTEQAISSIVVGTVIQLTKGFQKGDFPFTDEIAKTLEESLWKAISL